MSAAKEPTPPKQTGLRVRLAWVRHGLRQVLGRVRAALRAWRNRLPVPVKRAIRRMTRWTLHGLNGVLMAIVILFVIAHLWLPTLVEKKGDVENLLSTSLGNPVKIDQIDTFWDGLNPGVRVQGLRLDDSSGGQTAIRLRQLRLSLQWRALLTGRIAINSLVMVEPSLVIEHLANGQFRITGLNTPTTDGADQDIGELLLGQREIVIENGRFEWVDAVPEGQLPERLRVERVNVSLRNEGDRHTVDLYAAFPKTLCAQCRVTADIRGNPLRDRSWTGELSLQARDLTLTALPRLLRERLPAGLAGTVQANLTSRWRDNWPEMVQGRIGAHDFVLPVPGKAQPVTVRGLDTELTWEGDVKRGQIDFERLALGLTRSPWQAGKARIEYAPDKQRLEVSHLDIEDIARFLRQQLEAGPAVRWLEAAHPAGGLDRVRLEVDGPIIQPRDFRLTGNVQAVRFAAHEQIPGFSALSGQLHVTRREGEFLLESGPGRIDVPRILPEPLEVQRLESRLSWRQEPDYWVARATGIRVRSRDGRLHGDVELRVPVDTDQSPVLKVDVRVQDGDVAHTRRYIPRITPEPLRDYLEKSIVDGQLTEGNVRFQGALRNFPFRDGKGLFEVTAHVRDGVYRYLPDWEPVRDVEADLRFTGTDMQITATQGRLRELQVGRVTVAIDDFLAPDGALVRVNSRAFGSMSDVLGILESSKAPKFAPYLINGMHSTGAGILNLELQIPARNPSAVRIEGDYKFLGGSLALPYRPIRVDGLRGHIGFTEAGLQTGQVTARMFGSETRLTARPVEAPAVATRVDVRGRVTPASLEEILGSALVSSVRGGIPWSATAQLTRDRPVWSLEADGSPLELRFPAPFSKKQGEPLTLTVQGLPPASPDQLLVDLELSGRATGRLAFRRQDGVWQFDRGHLAAGERVSQLPNEPGLTLSARLAALNVDAWWLFLRPHIQLAVGGTGWFENVKRLQLEADSFTAFDRLFGHQKLDLSRSDGKWAGSLEGEVATGQAVFLPAGCSRAGVCPEAFAWSKMPAGPTPAVYLQLDQFVIPTAREPAKASSRPADPRSLPLLGIRSNAFRMGELNLGALELVAEPVQSGWQVENFRLHSTETQLTARGLWEIDWQARQSSHFDIAVTSTNFGLTLDQLGLPDQLVGGRLSVTSRWNWPGSPADWSLKSVQADGMLSLNNGRLPNISPGAGRLLGVLDVRSLTRYLMFDLSSVFGKGMTFDTIKGPVRIAQGNAYTTRFEIDGPGADIDLTGRIGLVDRDLDLEMSVAPRLVEEFAIGGTLLGGPVVGAVAGVLGKLAEKPTKDTQLKYMVTGPWTKPVIKNIGGLAPATEPAAEPPP